MAVWTYTLLSVALVSLISLVGVITLALKREVLQRILLFIVSFAVGGLFGDAFIHLIPAAYEKFQNRLAASLLVVAGILVFFVLEKFIRWRHCHTLTSENHPHPVVFMNIMADAIHNFFDGVVIGATYTVSVPLGLTTTLAVVLHEIPQEIGDFGILVHGGLGVKKAIAYNFLSALTAIAGALISLIAGPHLHGYSEIMLPITAGGFIYMAGTDLVPELHAGCETKPSSSAMQFIMIVAGIAVMALLILVE